MENGPENTLIRGRAQGPMNPEGSRGMSAMVRACLPTGVHDIGASIRDRRKPGRPLDLRRDPVGADKGNRSLHRWTRGVGLACSTREAGEGAESPTLWREGADSGSRKGTINSVSSGGNIPGTRRPV